MIKFSSSAGLFAECDAAGCDASLLLPDAGEGDSLAARNHLAHNKWGVIDEAASRLRHGHFDNPDAATFCPAHKPGAEPFAGTPRTKAFLDSLRGAETVNHPQHYGGGDNPYEAIKVIEAWGLGFCLGNTVKYIARHAHKGSPLEDLKKARWYLQREIERMEAREKGT